MTIVAWNTIATALNMVIAALLAWKIIWFLKVARRAMVSLREKGLDFSIKRILVFLGFVEDDN